MRENDICNLTEGVIWKKFLLFFLPIAGGTLFQQLYNTVDAVVVGKFVGTEALAAVGGSASQVVAVFIGFFVALSGGTAVVIAQLYGARNREAVSLASHSAIAFSILTGIALTAAGMAAAPALLRLMHTPADTMADSITYLQIYFSGTLFVMLFNMGSSILRAVGDSRRPLIYLAVCFGCNIALDLILVLVFRLGVKGVALATVASQALSTVLVMVQLCRTREPYRIELRRLRIAPAVMGQMLRIGVPAGLQATMYNFSNLIVQVAVNSLGTVIVAAWTMTGKLDGVFWALSNALGTAVMSFVGQNFGAGKLERVKQSTRVSMGISMGITAVLVVLLLSAGRWCLFLFSNDQRVIAATWRIMTYFVPFYFIWTLVEVLSGVLRGVGDAIVPVIITGLGICALRLVWVGTVFVRFHTPLGISLCYPVSWLITASALVIYYRRGRWMTLSPAGTPNPAARQSAQ